MCQRTGVPVQFTREENKVAGTPIIKRIPTVKPGLRELTIKPINNKSPSPLKSSNNSRHLQVAESPKPLRIRSVALSDAASIKSTISQVEFDRVIAGGRVSCHQGGEWLWCSGGTNGRGAAYAWYWEHDFRESRWDDNERPLGLKYYDVKIEKQAESDHGWHFTPNSAFQKVLVVFKIFFIELKWKHNFFSNIYKEL